MKFIIFILYFFISRRYMILCIVSALVYGCILQLPHFAVQSLYACV